jgi:hypothetical protein
MRRNTKDQLYHMTCVVGTPILLYTDWVVDRGQHSYFNTIDKKHDKR